MLKAYSFSTSRSKCTSNGAELCIKLLNPFTRVATTHTKSIGTYLQIYKKLEFKTSYICQLALGQTWSIPNQQTSQLPLKYEQRNSQTTNIPTELAIPTAIDQNANQNLTFSTNTEYSKPSKWIDNQ